MSITIAELFGFAPLDDSAQAVEARTQHRCPFIGDACTKKLRDGTRSGVCTVTPAGGGEVICCANRLYANEYSILLDIARLAFGAEVRLIQPADIRGARHDGFNVAVFGKRWGGELRIPQRRGVGGYFVDWILVLFNPRGQVQEFVAVEVQSIDTTGNYRDEREAYLAGMRPGEPSDAGLNWENVSKRIFPQLIYKGHVLRRERLCARGLFFVSPTPVYERVRRRLARDLEPVYLQPGALTFVWYEIGAPVANGGIRTLRLGGTFTTTTDQLALAFTAPQDLPPAGVYETAIRDGIPTP